MTKCICKKCGYIFKANIYDPDERKKIICKRCGSNEIYSYGSKVKKYWICNICKRTFKITDVAAIELMKNKENPICMACGSKLTAIGRKYDYLKDTGQIKKIDENKKQEVLFK